MISGTKMTMEAPKLSGFTRDARRYEVSASAAAQDSTKPDVIELKGMRAMLEMQDKSTCIWWRTNGLFDRKAGMLTLNRDIVLTSPSGFRGAISPRR